MASTLIVTDFKPTPPVVLDVEATLELIDKGLASMSGRALVSTNEVSNLLLDMRSLLASAKT